MDERERATRLTIGIGHFAGYGLSGDLERIRAWCNDTLGIPLGILADSAQLARQQDESGFAPPPGKVIKCALAISPHEHAGEYRGSDPQRPEWYVELLRSKRRRARLRLTPAGGVKPPLLQDGGTGSVVEGVIEALSAPKGEV